MQQLEAGDVGEVDVEQGHVGGEGGERRAGVAAVHRRLRFPLTFEQGLEAGHDRLVVVDDEQAFGHCPKIIHVFACGT